MVVTESFDHFNSNHKHGVHRRHDLELEQSICFEILLTLTAFIDAQAETKRPEISIFRRIHYTLSN